jgi:hypothetical protein
MEPWKKWLSRNNGWGRSEVLGNRAKLNILCPLWRTEEGDKCLCVCERERTWLKSFEEEKEEEGSEVV